MTRKLLLAVLLVAFVAVPAYASVQNIKVGGDIDSTWVIRDNFDLGTNIVEDSDQNFFMTQTRLRVDADLTDNVSAVICLINERAWDDESDQGDDSDMDLDLAYVTLREMLYSPLTVTIGRQPISYGNGLIVGIGGPNNVAEGPLLAVANDLEKRAGLDAVKMVFDYNPLTIDIFAAKRDANNLTSAPATRDDDIDLYGLNVNYQLGDEMDTVVEGYFFTRHDRSLQATVTGNGHKADTVYAPGLRASTNPIKGLNVQAEVAWQTGNKTSTHTDSTVTRADNIRRKAMAGQVIANYALPFDKLDEYNPVLSGSYTYASGDHNPPNARDTTEWEASAEEWTAWDPMFENQSGGTIYNTLFDLSNIHVVSASAQCNPLEDITTKVTWSGLWLDKKVNTDLYGTSGDDALPMRQPDAAGTINPLITSDTDVGSEIDADLIYDYTEDVQLGVSLGWFFPGDFFNTDNDDTASQILTSVDVAF